jgi:SagB-type dehydrogenase family enzyme
MDWSNQPRPFKIYPKIEGQPLPTDLPESGKSAFVALHSPSTDREFIPSLRDLAGLLYYTAGITKRAVTPGGQIYFRAAACTGALFHIELYLVCGDLPGLAAGVYHFGSHDFSLRRLREGDYRRVLVKASGDEPALAQAPAAIVTSSVYWRNSWKYQDRAYRHSYWDSGTMLANLLVKGNAGGIPVRLVTAFADAPVNQLLGLDPQREAALQIIPVGRESGGLAPPPPPVPPLTLEVQTYSSSEVEYPSIEEMHAASSIDIGTEAAALRGNPPQVAEAPPQGRLFPLDLGTPEERPTEGIESVIVRRGSSRRFRQSAIPYRYLSLMLTAATTDLDVDFLGAPAATLTQLYLIANNVEGLPPGSYIFHPRLSALEQLQEGDFREQAGYLGLEQELPRDASADVFFLTDLDPVLERYGNRGYRLAQMEASIRGGRLYVAAYALKLGASGLTFFDDDVTDFFSPHAQGKSVMFLIALGRPARRPSPQS